MAFRSVDASSIARFNSHVSGEFLDSYEKFVDDQIQIQHSQKPHKAIAPSTFRCDRVSWFRLRGTEPDSNVRLDRTLNFIADIGTACHRMIQTNLKNMLGDDWVELEDHLSDRLHLFNLTPSSDSLETFVESTAPPIRFACDGIIRINGKKYLLEIKTIEYSAWRDLSEPRQDHLDQVKLYCVLLQLDSVVFMYVDRQYGDIKCYQVDITESDILYIQQKVVNVLEYVDKGIAPPGLPKGDKWCNPNWCNYYNTCNQYGKSL